MKHVPVPAYTEHFAIGKHVEQWQSMGFLAAAILWSACEDNIAEIIT